MSPYCVARRKCFTSHVLTHDARPLTPFGPGGRIFSLHRSLDSLCIRVTRGTQEQSPVHHSSFLSEQCGEDDVFEDSEFGHVEYLRHFEKLFVFFCHTFLLCLAASYERIDAETAAFKLSVLPDMGI